MKRIAAILIGTGLASFLACSALARDTNSPPSPPSDTSSSTDTNTVTNGKDEKGHDANNSARNARDRDSQTLTPGDQGNNPADRETTRQVRKGIIAADGISLNGRNVKIVTSSGKVTLRGPVNSDAEKKTIGDIAVKVVGDKNVDNQLEVKLSPTGRQ